MPENIGLKLATDAEQAAMAKKLATIVIDAPIKMDLEKAKIGRIDRLGLLEAFTELGFKSLMGRVMDVEVKKEEKEEKKVEVKKEINDQLNLL